MLRYYSLKADYSNVLNNERYKELKNKRASIGFNENGGFTQSEQQEFNNFVMTEKNIQNKQDRFNNKIKQQGNNEVREEFGSQITAAVSKEVRTTNKAVDNAVGNTKAFKLKTRVDENARQARSELGSLVDKSMDSANKEVEFLNDGSVSRGSKDLEIEKNKAKVSRGVADLKETLGAVKDRNTQTATMPGSAHEEQVSNANKSVNEQIKAARRKPLSGKK